MKKSEIILKIDLEIPKKTKSELLEILNLINNQEIRKR